MGMQRLERQEDAMRNPKPDIANFETSGSGGIARHKRKSSSARPYRYNRLIDIAGSLDAALDLVAGRARSRQIMLVCEVPSTARIAADPLQMIAIIEGLLINAVTRSPAGGTVTCRIAAEVQSISIEVCDNGSRLFPEDLNRLLWPVPIAVEPSTEGEGLLDSRWTAIVKTFDPARIEGRSVVGGASFKLTLPVR